MTRKGRPSLWMRPSSCRVQPAPGLRVEDGLEAAGPALESPAPSGQQFPTEGGSRGLIWDPRSLRPCSKA